jgi:hypothetical protein
VAEAEVRPHHRRVVVATGAAGRSAARTESSFSLIAIVFSIPGLAWSAAVAGAFAFANAAGRFEQSVAAIVGARTESFRTE